MVIDYKPLWHLLLERNMRRTEMRLMVGVSARQLVKTGKNEDARTETPRKMCAALVCALGDIMRAVKGEEG